MFLATFVTISTVLLLLFYLLTAFEVVLSCEKKNVCELKCSAVWIKILVETEKCWQI